MNSLSFIEIKLRTSGSPNMFTTCASSFMYLERDSFLSSMTSLFMFLIFLGGNFGSRASAEPPDFAFLF